MTETPERLTFDQAAKLPKTDDGLTVARVWVELGGCPVWRGYDPDRQLAHGAGELTFDAVHGDHWADDSYQPGECLGADRCSCGGLFCGCGAHYPPEFLTELPHGTPAVSS